MTNIVAGYQLTQFWVGVPYEDKRDSPNKREVGIGPKVPLPSMKEKD